MLGYPSITSSDSLGNNARDVKSGHRNAVGGSASILVTWQAVPTMGPRGVYHIYLAQADEFSSSRLGDAKSSLNPLRKQRRWSEHSVSGSQNSTVVNNLRTGQPYFLLMYAQNKHGRSPRSALCFFRTAEGEFLLNFK